LWGYTNEMFEVDALAATLIEAGIAVDTEALRAPWFESVSEVLTEATLTVPDTDWAVEGGRRGIHTDDLGFLLAELQFMQRAYPGLRW